MGDGKQGATMGTKEDFEQLMRGAGSEEVKKSLEEFNEMKASLTYMALIQKIRYDALIEVGFNKKQALELCKTFVNPPKI